MNGRFLLVLALLAPLEAFPVMAGTTIYVGKHFEIRDHDQPTKYVFNGDTRIARVTGSLSTNTRIQRLRLQPGWNLLSLAVTATNALRQMTNSQSSILNSQSIVRWSQPTLTWLPVSPNETLEAGTVLWLHASTNTALVLSGTYSDPTNRPIAAGGSFLPGAGLEVWSILSTLSSQPSTAAWHFDSPGQSWQLQTPAIPGSDPGFPQFIAPGEAIFVNAGSPAVLEIPELALRVRYYHQDHLGSSSVMTDAQGALVEETAFYPFGMARHEHRPRQIEEDYKFTQKERDQESGLHYFEARYLAASLSRFIIVDPKYANPDVLSSEGLASFITNPQELNLYSYAQSNPIKYTDPSGFEVWIPFVDDLDELDVGQTLLNVSGPVGQAAARVSNFVGGTDFDTRSLLAQGVSAVSGSETAGDVTEAVAATVVGGGGVRATIKGVGTILRNPVAAAKGAWSALKQDVGLLLKTKPGAVGGGETLATAAGGTGAAGGGSIGTADTVAGTAMGRTLVPGSGGALRAPTMKEIHMSDPTKVPIIQRLDATAAARGTMSQSEAAEAIRRVFWPDG